MAVFYRIAVLLWADILAAYAMWWLQTYLTNVWGLSFTHAAGILNIWGGISLMLPLLFRILVDQFLGDYWMLVFSSIAYSVGMGFLSMSTPPVLGACKEYEPKCIGHTQKVLFYMALALVAVGTAGYLVSIRTFMNEQKERTGERNVLLQVPGLVFVGIFPYIGAIGLPYVKPWSLRFGIPAICTTAAALLFLSSSGGYNKVKPGGSPLINVCRVFVVSASRISTKYPVDADMYHMKDDDDVMSFSRTHMLRCLDKAAIKMGNDDPEQQVSKWKLCSMQEVEEAKIVILMIPICMTFIVCGIVSSIGNTYFLEQANKMNRKLGKWELPLPLLLMFFNWSKGYCASSARSYLSRRDKHAPGKGIANAMVFAVLCCIIAAKIESRRLSVIRSHDLVDKPDETIPMSIFWLLFQYFLLAVLDSFLEINTDVFYKQQAPTSMVQYLKSFTKFVTGLGFICSVLSVYVVGKISEKGDRPNWFQFTLNRSRLDRYYWVLAAMSAINLVILIGIYSCSRIQHDEEDFSDSAPDEEDEFFKAIYSRLFL